MYNLARKVENEKNFSTRGAHYDYAPRVYGVPMPRKKDEANSRVWNVLLYPDDPSHAFAIKALQGTAYSCVGILHDKDINEDGTPKKPHYHVVIKFTNARALNTVANELQIDPRFLEPCHSFRNSAEYLLHHGKPDKYQYSITECFGSLKKALEQMVSDDTEDERAMKILEILENEKRYISMHDFIKLCAEKGLFADLRRSGYLFVAAVKEHNAYYV